MTDYEHGGDVPPPVLVVLCQIFSVEWAWLTLGMGSPYLPSGFSFVRNNALLS